jgi:thiamine-phosphate diphosphorylase
VALVESAARAGVPLIQVRERDLEAGALAALVRACMRAVSGLGARILVNDRADVALACGAHGVHLRADGVPTARVRRLAPPAFLIGRSVHTPAEAAAASGAGADYLIAGTVLPTRPSPAPLDTWPRLRSVASASSVPVLAIGGMTRASIADVGRAGAAGIAAVGLFCEGGAQAVHVAAMIRESRLVFDTLRRVS